MQYSFWMQTLNYRDAVTYKKHEKCVCVVTYCRSQVVNRKHIYGISKSVV